jgi:hypothetical protein
MIAIKNPVTMAIIMSILLREREQDLLTLLDRERG